MTINYKLGLYLICLLFPSIMLASSIQECHLGAWCPLERIGDATFIELNAQTGAQFKCILAIDGVLRDRKVYVSAEGKEGYIFPPKLLEAKEGSYTTYPINGHFDKNNSGILIFTRMESETDVLANMVCEKL